MTNDPAALPSGEVNRDLSSRKVITLIAKREVIARVASKAFIWTTVITLLVLVAASVGSKLLRDSGGDDVTAVAVAPAAAPAAPLLAAAASSLDQKIEVRQTEEGAGREAVRDGKVKALVLQTSPTLQVLTKKELGSDLTNVMNVVAGQIAFDQQIRQLGGEPTAVQQTLANAKVVTQSLEPEVERDNSAIALGFIAGILIYLSLMMQGSSIAQGVVEEKSSRVVELLLATVRPWQLLAGKVIGVGVVGLIQIAIFAGGGAAAALATNAIDISLTDALGMVAWLLVWYVLGYFLYAFVLAALASLVSRQEDVGGVMTPALMFLVVGYVFGISVLPSDPDNTAGAILSVIPVFAPTLMPMRLGMGGVPLWQTGLAVALTLAAIPLVLWIGGRIHRNAVVRTGAKVPFREAFKAS